MPQTPSTSSDDPVDKVASSYPLHGEDGNFTFVMATTTPLRPVSIGPTYLHYSVNEKSPRWSQWLQRHLLRALDKLGASQKKWRNAEFKSFVIRRDAADFMTQLGEAYLDISRRYQPPTVCFVGPDAFMKLKVADRDAAALEPFSFKETLEFRSAPREGRRETYHREVLGMTVVFLPWLRGCFLA